jgi:hypothetical protein
MNLNLVKLIFIIVRTIRDNNELKFTLKEATLLGSNRTQG